MPTISPQPTKTPAPSKSSCQVEDTGFYGEIGSTDTQLVIGFGYEVENSSGDTEGELIPALEAAFSNAILPELFPESCAGRRRQRRLRTSAVSSNPEDIIFQDIKCAKIYAATNECVVVEGELTLFIDGPVDQEEAEILSILKTGMENGDFDNVHDGIVRVSYLEIGTIAPPVIGNPEATLAPEPASREGNNALIYGLVGGGAAVLIGLAAFVWRRTHRDDGSGEYTNAV